MRRDQREQEFAEFFTARGPALRRTAYLVVRDWHTAEDVTQQALAKMYAAWSRVRPETRMAYARRAVVNESLSLLRRHRPETPTQHLPSTRSTTRNPAQTWAGSWTCCHRVSGRSSPCGSSTTSRSARSAGCSASPTAP